MDQTREAIRHVRIMAVIVAAVLVAALFIGNDRGNGRGSDRPAAESVGVLR